MTFVEASDCVDCRYARNGPCQKCGMKGNQRNRKYVWPKECDEALQALYKEPPPRAEMKVRMDAIAALPGFPPYAARLRARELGLCRERWKEWTDAEQKTLEEYAGIIGIRKLARLLHRSERSVMMKLHRLKMSSARTGVYTVNQLWELFGVSDRTVCQWRDEGLLRPEDGVFDTAEVMRFLVEHPEAYDVRCVEREWLRDMLRRIGVMLADLRQMERAA